MVDTPKSKIDLWNIVDISFLAGTFIAYLFQLFNIPLIFLINIIVILRIAVIPSLRRGKLKIVDIIIFIGFMFILFWYLLI